VVKNRDLYKANQEIHDINTRYNANLHLPMANLTAYQSGPYFFGIKLFNHFLINIKNLSNETKLFTHVLKRFHLQHSFYLIEEYFNYNNK